MSNEKNPPNAGSLVQQKTTPAVGGGGKVVKYLSIVVMVILVIILGRGFFETPEYEKKKETAEIVKPAASTTETPLNLEISGEKAPASQPIVPVREPPPPPPPSILPSRNVESSSQADQTRIKSPTSIYGPTEATKTTENQRRSGIAGGDPNTAFLEQAANTTVVTVAAKRTTNMDYKILQGKLIAAVLETSINSDMPGMVRAVVSKDVYGDTGRRILLPRGTRLIGQYNSVLKVGQSRIAIAWTRAITPDHIDIALGSPSTDELGRAGMTGDVESHFWQIFGTSALLSVLGVVAGNNATTTTSSGASDYNPYTGAVTQGVLNSSNQVLQSRINIQPTIRVVQGSLIEVFVARDLDFSSLSSYQR